MKNFTDLQKSRFQNRELEKEHGNEIEAMDYVESLAALMLLGETKQVERALYGNEEEEAISVCKAIDDMIEDGRIEGRIEGENRLSKLINSLLQDNCFHLISQIVNDKVLREQMYQKYQL